MPTPPNSVEDRCEPVKEEKPESFLVVAGRKIGEYAGYTNVKFRELMESAQKNYNEMVRQTYDNTEETRAKLEAARKSIGDKLESSREATLKRLDEQYKVIYEDNEVNKQKVADFRQNLHRTFDDVGDHMTKNYKEAKDQIRTFSVRKKSDFAKFYEDIKTKLNQSYEEALKKHNEKLEEAATKKLLQQQQQQLQQQPQQPQAQPQ